VPLDLADLLEPGRSAVVTQECQKGVLGDGPVVFPELAEIARVQMIPNAARIAKAARTAGVPVVHCIAERRPDGLGSSRNARLFAAARRSEVQLSPSSEAVEVIDEVGCEDGDLVSRRLHGIGPMWGTDLDPILRNLGVRTVVAVGASVNVGITNLVMDAVNAGYQVVLPRDAVAGIPAEYADTVIDNTLSLLATVVTTDDVIGVWA
jgi:nicotinamidase-related amidase